MCLIFQGDKCRSIDKFCTWSVCFWIDNELASYRSEFGLVSYGSQFGFGGRSFVNLCYANCVQCPGFFFLLLFLFFVIPIAGWSVLSKSSIVLFLVIFDAHFSDYIFEWVCDFCSIFFFSCINMLWAMYNCNALQRFKQSRKGTDWCIPLSPMSMCAHTHRYILWTFKGQFLYCAYSVVLM